MRLALLKPVLASQAQRKWSHHAKPTSRVLDVLQGTLTWIIGTVYMDMPLKPQVLQDLANDIDLSHAIPTQTWRDPRLDVIQLEDESGRICITGARLLSDTLCTGIVMAVLGTETSSGDFEVIDIIYPADCRAMTTQSPTIISEFNTQTSQDQYIAVVSGLEIEGKITVPTQLSMLVQYLTGQLGDLSSQSDLCKISHLVILGNSFVTSAVAIDDAMTRKLNKNKKYGYDSALYNPRPMIALDSMLEELCLSMNVIIVPGESDPTNVTLPQQPMNNLLFERSAQFDNSTLKQVSNPSYLTISGRSVFCSAGQNIEDIMHYVNHDPVDDSMISEAVSNGDTSYVDPIDVMEDTLKWRHAAPTAPDTLWTYPFPDRDPFILTETPDLYIVGNQISCSDRLIECSTDPTGSDVAQSCRLIAVSKFAKTGEVVLVNTRTLEVDVIQLELAECL